MEQKTVNARFEQLLKQAQEQWGRGVQKKIAEIVGVVPQTVTYWKQGVHEPSQLEMDAISAALGNGSYPIKPTSGIVIQESKIIEPRVQLAPLISWASAGNAKAFIDQGHDVERYPTLCRDPNCYCLEIEGDSMEPEYLDRDILFVIPVEAQNGELVVAKTRADEVYFKRYHWTHFERDPVKLTSLNNAYPVIEIPRKQFRFIHRVHSSLRILRKD